MSATAIARALGVRPTDPAVKRILLYVQIQAAVEAADRGGDDRAGKEAA